MGRRTRDSIIVVAVAVTATVGLTTPAAAHESPPGCTTSALNFGIDQAASGIGIIRRNGDQLNLAARIRNDISGAACSYTDVDMSIQVPNPDGTPGATTQIADNINVPAGTAQFTLPTTVPHTVDYNDSTFSGFVTVIVSGTGHFPGGDITGPVGSAGSPLVTSKPSADVSVAPIFSSGAVPFGAQYQYTLTNTSIENTAPGQPEPELTNATDEESVLSDDTCSALNFTGGNTDNEFPPAVDRGETWTFTCNRVFDSPGTFTNTVSVTGFSTRDGRTWPATTDQSTVTANGSDLRVAKSHDGDFVAGQSGRTYTIVARNAGNDPTSGAVTVQDSLPAGLTATAIDGAGWSCDLAGLSCTRSDALAGGAQYPPVTVTVDVLSDAPEQLTNVASVAGGGESVTGNNTASDETRVARPPDPPPDDEPEDRDPPDGEIRKVKVKGDDAKVTFRSDEAGSTFECRLDKKKFKPCTSPKRYRNLDDGRHRVFVIATDPAGNADGAVRAKFEID